MYIRGLFEALDIKKYFRRGVESMEVDTEGLKAFYADLLAKREEAKVTAVAKAPEVIAERQAEFEQSVKDELVAKAIEPFAHDIELCEKFLKETETTETENETETTGTENVGE